MVFKDGFSKYSVNCGLGYKPTYLCNKVPIFRSKLVCLQECDMSSFYERFLLRKWFDCVPDNGEQVVGSHVCMKCAFLRSRISAISSSVSQTVFRGVPRNFRRKFHYQTEF